MSFTYDPTLADEVSQVRFYLDDTIEDFADFQDEEIQYLLDNNRNIFYAAAEAAFRLYTSYSKRATISEVDDVRVEWRSKSAEMKALYESLKKKAKDTATDKSKKAPIFFGGLNKDTFDANRSDDSLTPRDFTKGTPRFNNRFPETTDLDSEFKMWNTAWSSDYYDIP